MYYDTMFAKYFMFLMPLTFCLVFCSVVLLLFFHDLKFLLSALHVFLALPGFVLVQPGK